MIKYGHYSLYCMIINVINTLNDKKLFIYILSTFHGLV